MTSKKLESELEFLWFAGTQSDPAGFARALDLRVEVFVQEQGIPMHLERDARDEGADHLVLTQEGESLGVGRLTRGTPGWGRLGRLAVARSWRGHGLGRALVEALETKARARGLEALELSSQLSARNFYLRLGYRFDGGVFLEDGVLHRRMIKELSPPLEA